MGTDFISDNPLGLMKGRLGIYDSHSATNLHLSGRDHSKVLLDQMGGARQQERMILNKKRSLQKALYSSYQGADILKWGSEDAVPVRALMNPNKLKQDYDDKVVSVEFDYGFQPGDIFEWVGTGTYWLIYLQDLTELAYFRGDVRKCSYKIAWEDELGERHETYAAVRGPVETKLKSASSGGAMLDIPNLSLNLLLPLTEETLKYFQRYAKFYLQTGNGVEPKKVCWRVEALDWVSTPGVLEVAATEYYANDHEDDIENGIVGGLIVEEENTNSTEVESTIVGESFIKPKFEYVYTYTGTDAANWGYDTKLPVNVKEFTDESGNSCVKVKWTSSYSGQFELSCNGLSKTIVVESLF